MAKIAVVGDSQSVNPGAHAEEKLKELGHSTERLSNVGMGPYDYVRISSLWQAYTSLITSFKPDLVFLIFGTNDAPNQHLVDALVKMKKSVKPKVVLTGPPQYPDPTHQAIGLKIQAVYSTTFGADYFDSYPYTSPSLPRAADGLHFTYEGARTWGEAIGIDANRRLKIV